MVTEINHKGKRYFKCDECGFIYKSKDIAEKCEKWCAEHNSCNLDITSNAVQIKK